MVVRSTKCVTSGSTPAWSSSSKLFRPGLSISKTPNNTPFLIRGITISEREAESHTKYSGKPPPLSTRAGARNLIYQNDDWIYGAMIDRMLHRLCPYHRATNQSSRNRDSP